MGTVVIQEEAGHEVIQVLSLLLLCESHGNRGVFRFAMALDRPWIVYHFKFNEINREFMTI